MHPPIAMTIHPCVMPDATLLAIMTEKAASEGRAPLKVRLAQQLQERLAKYREQRDSVSEVIRRTPDYPIREKEANRAGVTSALQPLTDLWHELLPYIRSIKGLAGEILEPARFSACYFLFGKVANGFEALFLLAREGFHYEAMEIVRSNREALDLIILFLQESPDSPLLKKWFEGEIIDNSKAREAWDAYIGDFATKAGLATSPKTLKTDIYSTLSRYSHVAYGALLDAYDVYRQDFDFERVAGYHYVRNSSLGYIREGIRSVGLTLKTFYLSIGDAASCRGIDAVLEKYARDLDQP
jgi:hypothetical protein